MKRYIEHCCQILGQIGYKTILGLKNVKKAEQKPVTLYLAWNLVSSFSRLDPMLAPTIFVLFSISVNLPRKKHKLC